MMLTENFSLVQYFEVCFVRGQRSFTESRPEDEKAPIADPRAIASRLSDSSRSRHRPLCGSLYPFCPEAAVNFDRYGGQHY